MAPDFVGLAHVPVLHDAAVRCWKEGFRRRWEQPLAAGLRKARPGAPIDGLCGDLIAAIMACSRAHLMRDVVSEVERYLGR
jgi:hypothetical protein